MLKALSKIGVINNNAGGPNTRTPNPPVFFLFLFIFIHFVNMIVNQIYLLVKLQMENNFVA